MSQTSLVGALALATAMMVSGCVKSPIYEPRPGTTPINTELFRNTKQEVEAAVKAAGEASDALVKASGDASLKSKIESTFQKPVDAIGEQSMRYLEASYSAY